MSKYDGLNARSELEQVISADLEAALGKRGFAVRHNGTPTNSAPGGVADIDAWTDDVHLVVEATKATKTAQDREFPAITAHLLSVKQASPSKRCFCLYISPETPPRLLGAIRDWNSQRTAEDKLDLRILPLSFENAELWLTRLRESERDLYPVADLLALFPEHAEFADDLRIRKLLLAHVFPHDAGLAAGLREDEKTRDTQTLERLVKDLARLENYMRQNGVATAQDAIDALIYLVFLKLHEEKRERDTGDANRLRDESAYEAFLQNAVSADVRGRGRGIHHLFEIVKQEGTFLASGMFTVGTTLPDSLTDGFVKDKLLPVFSEYTFVGTGIDALGAVYEVLAQRAGKDVKVGQFFTPEAVVRFMVEMADLRYDDEVLDPACGTGRFLIYAMREMLERAETAPGVRDREAEKERVRKDRLHGADIDPRIAKIARMNMWVNGDGKTNIISGNGLVLHRPDVRGDRPDYDGYFDAVLANPPLGELNYQEVPFADADDDSPEAEQRRVLETFRRSPILPRKNKTEEQASKVRARLDAHRTELAEMEAERDAAANDAEQRKAHRALVRKVERKRATVVDNEALLADLDASLRVGREEDHEWEITGNNLKGGALFLAAIWHYLKDESRPDSPPEWRGGRMLVVLDEGILNTDSYGPVRDFLRRHFYIKAVVSLTRDAFVPISKTSTKTSIVYAIKKTDPEAVQREPVFFAHAERVGLDTKGNATDNHLDASDGADGVLETYRAFETAVRAAYAGNEFRPDRFEAPDLSVLGA